MPVYVRTHTARGFTSQHRWTPVSSGLGRPGAPRRLSDAREGAYRAPWGCPPMRDEKERAKEHPDPGGSPRVLLPRASCPAPRCGQAPCEPGRSAAPVPTAPEAGSPGLDSSAPKCCPDDVGPADCRASVFSPGRRGRHEAPQRSSSARCQQLGAHPASLREMYTEVRRAVLKGGREATAGITSINRMRSWDSTNARLSRRTERPLPGQQAILLPRRSPKPSQTSLRERPTHKASINPAVVLGWLSANHAPRPRLHGMQLCLLYREQASKCSEFPSALGLKPKTRSTLVQG